MPTPDTIHTQFNGGDLYYLHLSYDWIRAVGPPEQLSLRPENNMAWAKTDGGWQPQDGGNFRAAEDLINKSAVTIGLAEPSSEQKNLIIWNELSNELGVAEVKMSANRLILHSMETCLRRFAYEWVRDQDPTDPVFDDIRKVAKMVLHYGNWHGNGRGEWPGWPGVSRVEDLRLFSAEHELKPGSVLVEPNGPIKLAEVYSPNSGLNDVVHGLAEKLRRERGLF